MRGAMHAVDYPKKLIAPKNHRKKILHLTSGLIRIDQRKIRCKGLVFTKKNVFWRGREKPKAAYR